MRRLYITMSKLFPKSIIAEMRQTLMYAGINVDAEIWLGESLMLAIIVACVMFMFGSQSSPIFAVLILTISFATYITASYSIPFFIAEKRSETVEEALPSLLHLMSSDIRAGMTPFQAIKLSARDEFGILKEEMDKATIRALGTESFSDALNDMSNHIKLPALERSMKLFVRSIESGGNLARILEETARDISDNILLRKELMSSTRTYIMLIVMTIIVGAPVLFNLSIHFTERLDALRGTYNTQSTADLGIGLMTGSPFEPEFLVNVSTITILFTSLIASLLVGVIVNGNEKYGLKYAFVLVPTSMVVFYLIRYAVRTMAI